MAAKITLLKAQAAAAAAAAAAAQAALALAQAEADAEAEAAAAGEVPPPPPMVAKGDAPPPPSVVVQPPPPAPQSVEAGNDGPSLARGSGADGAPASSEGPPGGSRLATTGGGGAPASSAGPHGGSRLATTVGGNGGEAGNALPYQYVVRIDKPEKHNAVQCRNCNGWLNAFRFAFSYAEDAVNQQQLVTDPVVPDKKWWYKCVHCYALEHSVGLDDAMKDLMARRGAHAEKRVSAFKEARQHVVTEITFGAAAELLPDGLSGKKLKKMAVLGREQLVALFAPWAQAIRLKLLSLEETDAMVQEHKKLVLQLGEAMKSGSVGDVVNDISAKIDNLEAQITAAEHQAFKSSPQQTEYLVACEYSDEFVRISATVYLRSWYICSCGAAISSKSWKQLHPEFSNGAMGSYVPGQRWYCLCCPRRYRPRMGCLTELRLEHQIYWSMATIPPKDVQDIRGLTVEGELELQARESGQPMKSPDELYRSMMQYRPVTGSILRAATVADLQEPGAADAAALAEMVAILTPEGRDVLKAAPLFPWMQMFNWA